MDRNGNTRIRFLWDQTLLPGQVNELLPKTEEFSSFAGAAAPPEGFLTGVEFSAERINAALRSSVPEQVVPSRDTSGHGTAAAAIAAAGGRLLEGQYQGVAFESQLLVVKMGTPAPDSFPKTTELMRALTYVVKKAVALGMPLAVNLSFGNTYGSHDGTSLVERFLDNVSEIGRTVICVGSGNEGAAAGHAAGSFGKLSGPGEIRRIELSVAPYQRAFNIQIWKEYADSFRLRLQAPGGGELAVDMERAGGQSYVLENTEILVYVGEPSPYSINQEIYFDFLPRFSYVDAGIWSILLQPVETVTGNYDLYLPSSVVLNERTRFFTPAPAKTLTIPSTASKVITVGAYNAAFEAYADFSGRGYPMQNISAERIIPGTIKPDLAAPGVDIETIGPGGTFVRVSGTSFAAPFVTGSAALMMEWGERVTIWLSSGADAEEKRGDKFINIAFMVLPQTPFWPVQKAGGLPERRFGNRTYFLPNIM